MRRLLLALPVLILIASCARQPEIAQWDTLYPARKELVGLYYQKKLKTKSIILLILATATGLVITWIDSRPNWDDAGISVLMILSAATLWGYLSPQKPWLTALAVCIWIPLLSILSAHNFGGLLALIPGFIGAYLGSYAKRIFISQ